MRGAAVLVTLAVMAQGADDDRHPDQRWPQPDDPNGHVGEPPREVDRTERAQRCDVTGEHADHMVEQPLVALVFPLEELVHVAHHHQTAQTPEHNEHDVHMVPVVLEQETARTVQQQAEVQGTGSAVQDPIQPLGALAFVQSFQVQRPPAAGHKVEAEHGHQRHDNVGAHDTGDDRRGTHHHHAVHERLAPLPMPASALARGHGQRRNDQRNAAAQRMHRQHRPETRILWFHAPLFLPRRT